MHYRRSRLLDALAAMTLAGGICLTACDRTPPPKPDATTVRALELSAQLRGGNMAERRRAAEQLGDLASPAGIDALLDGLQDNQIAVQTASIRALGKIGDHRVTDALLPLLTHRQFQLRQAAAEALGHVPDPRLIAPLAALLSDPEASVQLAAALALGRQGPKATPTLLESLRGLQESTRAAAAMALGHTADPAAVAPLVEVLAGEGLLLKRRAAESLGMLRSDAGVEPLRRLLIQPVNDGDRKALDARKNAPLPPERVRAIALMLQRRHGESQVPSPGGLPHQQDKFRAAMEPELARLKALLSDVKAEANRRQIELAASDRLGPAPWEAMSPEAREHEIEQEIERMRQLAASMRQDLRDMALREAMVPRIGREWWTGLSDRQRNDAIRKAVTEPLDDDLARQARLCRQTAAEALLKINTPAAAAALVAVLTGQDNAPTEAAVLAEASLKAMGATAVTPLLEAALGANASTVVRNRCLQLLAASGDPRAVEAMLGLLRSPDAALRATAAGSLVEVKDPRVTERMLEVITDADARIRVAAASHLARAGDARAVKPLIHALTDGDTAVASAAATGLGELHDPAAVEPLISVLTRARSAGGESRTGDIASAAITALGKLKDARALPVLIQVLAAQDRWLTPTAATALGRIGDPRAITPLIDAVNTGHPYFGPAAVNALGSIGDVKVVPALLDQTVPPAAEYVARAKAATKTSPDPEASRIVGRYSYNRIEATMSLGRVPHPEAVDALLSILERGDDELKRAAVRALLLQGERAIPALKSQLANEKHPTLAFESAQVLGGMGSTGATTLLDAMSQGSPRAVLSAIYGMAFCRDARTVEPLMARLSDASADVRAAAVWTLGEIGDPRATASLTHLAEHDPEPRVRRAAGAAIDKVRAAADSAEAQRQQPASPASDAPPENTPAAPN